MTQVQVALGVHSYPIEIGHGLLDQVGQLVSERVARARRALVVTDDHVAPLYGARVAASLRAVGIEAMQAVVPAGEGSKRFDIAAKLYDVCASAGLERSSVVLALGGGVVGDLAGFVAATYLRGLPFVQIPTTLLAQVDSSIGGKTGIDLPQGKNLVGAFHQPALVVADLETLSTLPPREAAAGMAEVVKHAVIRDAELWTYLQLHLDAVLRLEPAVMAEVVARNCRIKAAVVEADEREEGMRAILNFGHTAGHALEAALGYGTWLHGECVAVGMMVATFLAQEAGILQAQSLPDTLQRLLIALGLPVRFPTGFDRAAMGPLMERDKKVEGGRIRWVLPIRVGEVIVTPDIAPEMAQRALQRAGG